MSIFTLRYEMALSELCSTVEALWVARDSNSFSLEEVLAYQEEADRRLREWAAHQGLPHSTAEELADVLLELRQRNTERFMTAMLP